MENFQNEQDIRWIKVTNPSTGEVYYIPGDGAILLQNITVSNATTASYASTSSYFSGSVSNAISASYAVTASYVLNSVSSSFASTSSYVQNAQTASYVLNSVSSSFASTSSYVQNAQTASYVLNSVSSSFASTSSYAVNHAVITSSYICDGILTANQTFATGSDAIIAFIDYLDPNGWLTSNQFKPTIAGYYNISFGVWLQNPGISSNQVNTQMRKNGNSMILSQQPLNNGTGIGLGGSRIIQMNGTTDYIDWTIFQGSGDRSTGTLLQGTVNGSGTWFSAFLLTQ